MKVTNIDNSCAVAARSNDFQRKQLGRLAMSLFDLLLPTETSRFGATTGAALAKPFAGCTSSRLMKLLSGNCGYCAYWLLWLL